MKEAETISRPTMQAGVVFSVAAMALFVTLGLSPSSQAETSGAVTEVAQQAVGSLGRTPAGCVVVAAPLTADQPVPKANDLAVRIAALVAGKIGQTARFHPQTAPLGAARAIAGRASALVYVQAEISRGDLRATVDVYPSLANAWDRIRNPVAPPTGHAFATAKIDAEVRAFLAPLLLEQASVHRARHEERDVLAAACGDVDGDGGDEIVLVSRERVALGHIRDGAFLVQHAAAWADLSGRAPVPMREPLGGAALALGLVAVGSTDRASVSLGPDFMARAPLRGVPVEGLDGVVCLRPEASAGGFDGAPSDCALTRDAKPKLAVPAPRYDAFAAASVNDGLGGVQAIVAVREPSGRLKLRIGETVVRPPDGFFGAELAVSDFDQDGAADLATTGDGPDDAVDVWTVSSPGGDLRSRLHVPAPAGVRALAVCPPEEGGAPTLVAVVGSELWLIRAGTGAGSESKGHPSGPQSLAP